MAQDPRPTVIPHDPAVPDPHGQEGLVRAGAPLPPEAGALVLVHGRGADPSSMLELARAHRAEGFTFLAPRAHRNTWYPNSFLAPMAANEPWLSSALAAVGSAVHHLREAGVPAERIVFMGFSQGACLASEWVRRNPARYGGLVAYSGGLIGPLDTTWDPEGEGTAGSLAAAGTEGDDAPDTGGMPVFLGCSDVDHHIPVERVHETARVLEAMGARVEKRIYPGMGHTVNADEVAWTRGLLDSIRAEGG